MRISLACWCFLAAASSLAGQEFTASTPEWMLRGVRLVQFAEDGVVHLAGKVDKTFPAVDLVSLRREKGRLPEHPRPPFLLLTSGERIPLDREAGILWQENRVAAVTRGLSAGKKGSAISVPLAYLALACLDHPHAEEESEVVLARLLRSKRKSDVILLSNGDQVEGRVLRRAPTRWQVQAGARTVELDLERIAVLAVNPERLITPRTKTAYFRVVASNGARLDFLTLRLDQERGVLLGKTLFGASLEAPLKEVVALETRQGRAVFLSGLPAKVEAEPFLAFDWPLGRDRNVLSRPLRLSDGVYDMGLSMTAGMSARFDLKGGYRWFEARIGLDERDGRLGRARAEVHIDWKKVKVGGELSASDEPVEVRLDVSGAKTLTLTVQTGSRAGVQPVVNWGDARLLK